MRTSKSTHIGSGARNAEEEQFPVAPLGGDVGHGAAAPAGRSALAGAGAQKSRASCWGKEGKDGGARSREFGVLGPCCWERRLSVGERQRRASGPARKTASHERPAVAERDGERETERRRREASAAVARVRLRVRERGRNAALFGGGGNGEGLVGGQRRPGPGAFSEPARGSQGARGVRGERAAFPPRSAQRRPDGHGDAGPRADLSAQRELRALV